MPEARSPLAAVYLPGRHGAGQGDAPLTLTEVPLGTLFQIAGWPESFAAKAGAVLRDLGFAGIGDYGTAQRVPGALAFRIAPERVLVRLADPGAWHAVAAAADAAETPTLDLGHSRSVIRVAGPAAADLLARLVPIDLHAGVFPRDCFAQTGLHGVAVLLHRGDDGPVSPAYDLYVPYTWAASIWELVAECAAPFGYQVASLPFGEGDE